jgi:hypothetical protein
MRPRPFLVRRDGHGQACLFRIPGWRFSTTVIKLYTLERNVIHQKSLKFNASPGTLLCVIQEAIRNLLVLTLAQYISSDAVPTNMVI